MAVISAANLKWYLSGGAANSDPAASLGGARSTTVVGETLNDLFDDVSGAEAAAGDDEYRCVYFRNEDANANGLMDAKLWIESNTPGGDSVEIGLDLAGKNGTADTVADEDTAPDPAVSFSAAASKAAGLTLATPLAQNDYQAVWVKRIVPGSCAAQSANAFQLKVEGDTA